MAVNPNIALSFQAPKIESPVNMMAQMQQLQGGQQANELRAMQMADMRTDREQQNALSEFMRNYQPGVTDSRQALSFGRPGAQVFQQLTTAARDRAAGERSRAEAAATNIKVLRDLLPNITPDAFPAWQQAAKTMLPEFAQMFEGEYSPERVRHLMTTATDYLRDDAARRQTTAVPPGSPLMRDGVIVGQAPAAPQQPPRPFAVGGAVYMPDGTFRVPPRVAGGAGAGAEAGGASGTGAAPRPGVPGKPILSGPLAGQRVNAAGQLEDIPRAPGAGAASDVAPAERLIRDARFPQASSAFRSADATMDTMIKDLEALRIHPGLAGMTGFIDARIPNFREKTIEAQALFNKILARGGFAELAAMRAASPTGGALGNVSDREGQFLRQAFAALDPTQSADSIKRELGRLIIETGAAKGRLREAYDQTYAYRNAGAEGGATLSPQDAQALEWANANPTDSRAAEIKQRLGAR
jgi:hypothetical protein